MSSDQDGYSVSRENRTAGRDFAAWVAQHPNILPVTPDDVAAFVARFERETDVDVFAVSPAYYLSTGRNGLWVYEKDGSFIPFCRHPVDPQQVLIFPPRGGKNVSLITDFLNEAVAPAGGFSLARFKPEDIGRLQVSYAFVQRVGFAPVVEKTMDWRYGARFYATTSIAAEAAAAGWQGVPLSTDHIAAATALIDPASPLAGKYRKILDLVACGLTQGFALLHDGALAAAVVWDIARKADTPTAAVHAVLGEQNILPIALRAAAAWLSGQKIGLIGFGGETTALIERGGLLPPAMIKLDLCSVRAQLNDDLSWGGYNEGTAHMRSA